MGETLLSLITRHGTRPPSLQNVFVFDGGGLRPREITEINGESASGKSLLMLDIIKQSIMPLAYDGAGAHAIVIDCDGSFNVFRLAAMMESKVFSVMNSSASLDVIPDVNLMNADFQRKSDEEKQTIVHTIIKQALSRLRVIKIFSFDSLLIQLHYIKRLLVECPAVSLICLDGITELYWHERGISNNMTKMDSFINNLLNQIQNCLGNFYISFIFSRPSYFHTNKKNYVPGVLNLGNINTVINLKIKLEDGVYSAEVQKGKASKVYFFSVSENGINWNV